MRYAVAVVLLLLAGCGTSPYLEVGVGYQIDDNTDYWLQRDRSWTCDGALAHAELGLEFERQWRIGYHHQSHWGCGGPFNDDPEVYQDEIILTKKFGGKK